MEKKYPIGGYAPGDYWHKACKTCGAAFVGDKRAWNCELCGEKLAVVELPTPEPVGKFIMDQPGLTPMVTGNGYYWHYKDVIMLLTRYLEYKREATPQCAVWVNATKPKLPGDYYCKCKVDGNEKRLIVEFDKNGHWGEAAGYDYYEDFEIVEWLDESGQAHARTYGAEQTGRGDGNTAH